MHVLAALALLVPLPPTPPSGVVIDAPNRVEVCSLASGACERLAASALDPTVAGQSAFVDPVTGALTTPTTEQLEELAAEAGPIATHEESRLTTAVDTVVHQNGTVVARPAGGFLVELTVTVPATSAPAPVATPVAPPSPEVRR